MASYGFYLPGGGAGVALSAVGQTGINVGGQVVLVTSQGGDPGTAAIHTDKADYAPGETVTITGTGFKPGEAVSITLLEDPEFDTHPALSATADGTGHWVNTQFSPDAHDVDIRFIVTASGGQGSVAQTTFTDAKPNKVFDVGPQVPSPVSAGNAATYSVQVSFNGNSASCDAVLSVSALPAGASASFAPVPASNPPNTITSTGLPVATTLTVGTTAGTTPADASTFRITATGTNPACVNVAASTNAAGNGGTAADPTLVVSAANQTIAVTSPAPASASYGSTFPVAATASSGLAVAITTTGGCSGGGSASATITMTSSTTTCVVRYDQNGNGFYNPAPQVTSTTFATKANATIVVTPYQVTYDGNAHTATGTATGVGGVDLNASLALTGTTHTNAGDYPSDAWSFAGGANYNDASGTVHDIIDKADATITITPYHVTYDGNAHTSTGTATGVGGADLSGQLMLTGTTHTAAADYPSDGWSFAGGTNYNDASGTVHDIIDKADATISITPYHVTYDGNAHTSTGTATGVGGADLSASMTLTGTTHMNAGDYPSDAWSFAGGTNYNDASGTVHDIIDKANAAISVTPYSVTYDGAAHTATGTATGVGSVDLSGQLTLTGTTHTNAADYPSDAWSFAGGTNYNDANGTVHDLIDKANAVIA